MGADLGGWGVWLGPVRARFHTLGGQRSQPEVMPRQLSPQPQLEFLPWAVTQPEARCCPG